MPALIRAMRPRQWVKNLLVFAPFLFAQEFHHEGRLLRVVAIFTIFTLLASGVYLVNDIADRESDRLHPKKRFRPIASGDVSVGLASVTAVLSIVGALAWLWFGLASKPLMVTCVTYLVIQALYTWRLKHMVILDVLCIASGFVLRLLAGGTAAWVRQSQWILLCTIFLSLFLALAKRRHEVATLGEDARHHRAALAGYPLALLDQLISVATGAALVSYTLYAFDEGVMARHGWDWPLLGLTVPFVIYGLFRYLYLVYREGIGGSPTEVLLTDRAIQLDVALYAVVVGCIFRLG